MVLLIVALLWVPLTAHCRLAALPGLEFLRCESHSQEGTEDHRSCDHCGCCALEQEKYSSVRWDDLGIHLDGDLMVAEQAPEIALGLPPETGGGQLSAAPPPEESVTWVFVLRLALPVRAPSLAS